MFNSKFSRRQFLKTSAAVAALPTLSALNSVSFAATGQADHTVINVFLRGGMDSLSALIPYTEQAYFDARPTIAIPEAGRTVLNEQFALHHALSPLQALYDQGDLAFVVAAGLGAKVTTRSHFSAQRIMESGSDDTTQADGWLGRYLAANNETSAIFRGVGMGEIPKSLRGYNAALGLPKLSGFGIKARGVNSAKVPDSLRRLYAHIEHPLLANQATQTLTALDVAASNALGSVAKPAAYGNSKEGDALHQVAELLNADIGLEAANVDIKGWDMHSDMGHWSNGELSMRFSNLSRALVAFYDEISAHRSKVTIIVTSEFGRRVAENNSGGADHGKGGAMMVLGSGIAGGQVYGDWPGLAPENLNRGDLQVTTDHRQVLSEIIERRLGRPDLLSAVLPDYTPEGYLGICG
ncbi:DUF1501 domain-containing protein [Leucothrix sargassi]|nr:DUF1501 domain-containing protein [Leucothrix sargassi]